MGITPVCHCQVFPIPFSVIAAFAVTAFDVMLVGTAVTFNTVVKLAYAFFNVFTANIGWRVLMASVARKLAVIIAHMAGHAGGAVVTVKDKILVVIKGGGSPLLLCMTLATVTADLLMQGVFG